MQEKRWKNAKIVGRCECGGEVRVIVSGRIGRITICMKCGMENPRIRKFDGIEEEIVKAMRKAYEQLRERGIEFPNGVIFARVVEWLVGKSLPEWMWRKESEKWLEKAGLKVENGVIVRR